MHPEQLRRERPSGVLPIAALRLAVAQPLTVSGDVAANARRHADAVRAATARVVVFPECSLTGYELDAAALDAADARLDALAAGCRETGSVALAGAIIAGPSGGDERSIGIIAVDGDGARVVYRKIHLGGAEPRSLVPGVGPSVFEVDGWRLGLAVCRDTGRPEHAAATVALGIDVYVAGVLEMAVDEAVPEARARRVARDHAIPVAIASFAGSTAGGYDSAAGRSGIWLTDGAVGARAGATPGEVAVVTLTR